MGTPVPMSMREYHDRTITGCQDLASRQKPIDFELFKHPDPSIGAQLVTSFHYYKCYWILTDAQIPGHCSMVPS
jgi:hypothetical protein